MPVTPQVSRLPDAADLARRRRPRRPPRTRADDGGLRPVPGAEFAELPVDEIRPNPRQPRTVFDEDELAELVGSIREIGVLQPVVVRRARRAPRTTPLRAHHGRAAAACHPGGGLDTVPAIIRDTEEDDLLRDALLENLHRSQLNALEEAAAYQQLLDDFGCTQEELATTHQPLAAADLQHAAPAQAPAARPAPRRGRRAVSAGHARALLGLPDAAAMERLAQRIVAEGLSVRTVEEIVTLGGGDARPARRAPRAGARHAAARRPRGATCPTGSRPVCGSRSGSARVG